MADTERNLFILLSKMRGLSRVTKILSRILPIIIKGCLGLPRKVTSLWMRPKQTIYPRFPLRKINFLTALYAEEEVRNAVFQMEHNKAPGPDGFPAEFYQNFWEVIKSDLLELFTFLHAGQLELFR
jgi:hypothetical protein